MSAIMQQNYVPSANLRAHLSFSVLRWRRTPVISRHVPHHRIESKFANNSQRYRSPSPKRRSKQVRMLSNGVRNRALALQNLISYLYTRFKNQQWMCKRMIPNNVAGLNQITHDVRPLLNKLPNQKKRSPHI